MSRPTPKVALNTGCTADLDEHLKALFKVPSHWLGPRHNFPAAWTTLCNEKWHSQWDLPSSKCCKEVQQLWQGTLGQRVVLRSFARDISDRTYYTDDLDRALLECVYHDMNQARYGGILERSGLTAAQLGDAIYLLAVEASIMHFSDSWKCIVGENVNVLTERSSNGRLSTISDSALVNLWQLELFHMLRPVRNSTVEFYKWEGSHGCANQMQRCLFILAAKVLGMRQNNAPESEELTEAEDLWYMTVAMLGFHAIQRHLGLREVRKNRLRGLPCRDS